MEYSLMLKKIHALMGLIAINTPVTTDAVNGDLKQKLKPRSRNLKRAFGRLTAVAFVTTALSTASTGAFAKGNADKPAEVIVQSTRTIVEYRYVGVTAHEDDGSFQYGGALGMPAINKACADDFGEGARAATISEVSFRNDDGASAWVGSGNSPMVAAANGAEYIPIDTATGVAVGLRRNTEAIALLNSYCRRYETDEHDLLGVTVTPGGGTLNTACQGIRPAACSAPTAIPVR
jgi:hypothetical protein